MSRRKKLVMTGAAVALLLLSFAGGRYSRPARVELREHVVVKTETVEKIVNHDVIQTQVIHDKAEARNVETRIEWRTAPDGKPIVTQVTKDLTKTSEHTDDARQSVSDHKSDVSQTTKTESTKVSIVTNARPNWSASLMPGLDVRGAVAGGLSNLSGVGLAKSAILGASVERRILGPVFVGAWGNTAGAGGLTVRIEF